MTLKGLVNSSFTVQVKMHAAIDEDHTIKLAPAVKGVVEATTDHLVYTPSNYGTNQPYTLTGKVVGHHKIVAKSTVPYYENKAHELKETITEFYVDILAFIGWQVFNTTYANATSIMGFAKVTVGGTALEGLGGTFGVGKTGGGVTGNGLCYKLIKPDASVVALDTDISGTLTFIANLPGVYYLYASTRTGAGAGSAISEQLITLTHPAATGMGDVATSASYLYFVDAGTQSVSFAATGSSNGTMTSWTSHHPNVFAEVFPCSLSCWYTPSGGSGGIGDWNFTAVSAATIAWSIVSATGWSGGSLWRQYGYTYSDPSGFPPYDGVHTEWHFSVARVTNTATF